MNKTDLWNKIIPKLPKWMKKLIFRKRVFDPIKEVLEEWEESIYDGESASEILDKVRGNPKYINFALQVRMKDSAYQMEKLTKWIIGLTVLMLISGILQLILLIRQISV